MPHIPSLQRHWDRSRLRTYSPFERSQRCLTSLGLQVRTFLNLLPASEGDAERFDSTQPLEVCLFLLTTCPRLLDPRDPKQFSVTDVWSVPYVGTVVNGLLNCGTIQKGDPVLFGPDSNGAYAPTVVKTMQRKRADVTTAVAGQTVALALKHVPRAAVRKGMVIVHRTEIPPRGAQYSLHPLKGWSDTSSLLMGQR